MDFDFIRVLNIFKEVRTGQGLTDYKVIIYSLEPLRMSKPMVYKDISDCFNCKVQAFDIDFDKKMIYIRSEVI